MKLKEALGYIISLSVAQVGTQQEILDDIRKIAEKALEDNYIPPPAEKEKQNEQ